MVLYNDYTWVFVLGTLFAFYSAFGIGANDVANSFAGTVAAKSLTIGQALLIASICEFSGAIGLGASVTRTIKNSIADINEFVSTPDLFMFGLMCCLLAAAIWYNLACYLELPVSTTHTIIGALVGMAMVTRGGGAVVWSEKINDFPYLKGVSVVFVSWIVSPISAAIVVAVLFGSLKYFVLKSRHSFSRGLAILPFCVVFTFFIITIFIIQTGNKSGSWKNVSDGKAVWISLICAVVPGFFTWLLIMPKLKKWVEDEEERAQRAKDLEDDRVVRGMEDINAGDPENSKFTRSFNYLFSGNSLGRTITQNPVSKVLLYSSNQNIHGSIEEDEKVQQVWVNAEVFDYKTERLFRYLQVFTSMVVSFAHGSNDVGNAIGPYSGIYSIWETREVSEKANVPHWMYALGGAGIVTGLSVYGFPVMEVLGVKMVKVTSSRGFVVELSTSIVILVSSRYGLPVSTTLVAVGAIVAVGLFEGKEGVNWPVFLRACVGWIVTVPIAALLAAAFVSWGAFGPAKRIADDIRVITDKELKSVLSIVNQLNSTNFNSQSFNSTLNATLYGMISSVKKLNSSNYGYAYPLEAFNLEQTAVSLLSDALNSGA